MPNFSFEFQAARADDKQIVEAAGRVLEDIPWKLAQAGFTFPFSGGSVVCPADKLADHRELQEILSQRLELITHFSFKFAGGRRLSITRGNSEEQVAKVTLTSSQNDTPAGFARIIAAAKRHFAVLPPAGFVQSLVGNNGQQQFEAREAALARLEATAAHLLTESEQARKRWEAEYRQKENELAKELRQRTEQLDAAYRDQKKELAEWEEELASRQQKLNAASGRHQLVERLRADLMDPGTTLELSRGARRVRRTVSMFTLLLLILFGGAAGYYLWQVLSATDSGSLILAGVNQALFTALFLATSVFFIRWQSRWFHRRAAEEFKCKRYEMEVSRASWLAEMAFEWKEKFGTDIPAELFAKLTGSLFTDGWDKAGSPRQLAATLFPKSDAGDHGRMDPSDGRELPLCRPNPDDLAERKPK